jgi:hypothetical protein
MKLIITSTPAYLKKMKVHLEKEHPKTKGKIKLRR